MVALDKSQFMKKVINDYYEKRRKKRTCEAEVFAIERARIQKRKADKAKNRGVFIGGYDK